jgi:hypothetical protein
MEIDMKVSGIKERNIELEFILQLMGKNIDNNGIMEY